MLYSFLAKAIDVRCGNKSCDVAVQIISPELIRKDEQDIGFVAHGMSIRTRNLDAIYVNVNASVTIR
jgi:hypothetical protein